ncbi:MAG: hypothetical protein DWB56_07190 [Candidatus Jettenia sp.]|nr:hypothetical protein [Candidatus Jettenia sp.]
MYRGYEETIKAYGKEINLMYKDFNKKYWILFSLFFLFSITGCTQFSLNLQDRVQNVNTCQISVIDSRADENIFINALAIKTIPPVRQILYTKLCQRNEIQKAIREGMELTVYISNIQCGRINHYIYSELIGGMTGQIQVRKPGEKEYHEYLIMPSFSRVNKPIFAKRTIYKDFIEYIVEGFVADIEKNIYKIKEDIAKQ